MTFILPVLCAIVLGFFASIISWQYWPEMKPIGVGAITAFVVFGILIFLRVNIERLEKMLNIDLNRDGVIGRRNITPKDLLAKMARDGKNISEAALVPDIMSRKQYHKARAELLEENILRWKNPKAHSQGVIYAGGAPVITYMTRGEGEPIELH